MGLYNGIASRATCTYLIKVISLLYAYAIHVSSYTSGEYHILSVHTQVR